VAIRRRKSPAISAAGHGVKPDEPAPAGQLPLSDAEPSSPQPPATHQAEAKPEPEHFSSTLGEQIRAQQAYAEQQRQMQRNPLAMYLASIPGMSMPKLNYLAAYFSAYPDRLNGEHWNAITAAHMDALNRGFPDDSDGYFHHINDQLHRQHAYPPPSPAPPPPVHEPMPAPPEPALAHDIESEHSDSGEPEEAHMNPAHVSAPVSRSGGERYAMSGDYEPTANSIRLTAAEREIANLPGGAGEEEYARQKLKMLKLKRANVNRDQG
jgi:hypothetical protein